MDALPGLTTLINIFASLAGVIIQVVGALGQLVAFPFTAWSRRVVGFGQGIQEWLTSTTGNAVGRVIGQQAGRIAAGRRSGTQLDLTTPRSGGGRGHRTDEAARHAHEFDTEQRRLQLDNLRAQLESTQALDERNALQGQIASVENDQWLADLRFKQRQGEINQTQANRLIELKNQLIYQEALSRALEYNQHVAEQENQRAEQQEGYARDRAQSEADMAQTMEERRRLELELLRITIEQRRRALQALIDQANARHDPNAAATAQLELDNLGNLQSRETRRIMRDTRGPLESFMAGLPDTAAKLNEALQNVAVEGLQAISDGLVDVITGARKMGDVFRSVVTSIISDLLRIQLQRAIIGPLTNALSGIFGGAGGLSKLDAGTLGWANPFGGARAAGGPVLPGRMYLVGEKGPELLQMGGTGGHVIANDNIGAGGDIVIHQSFKFDGVAVTKDEFIQGLMATKFATMDAVRQARRRVS